MIKKFFLFVCLLVPFVLYAANADILLQKKLNNFQSMKANFQQVVVTKDGTVLQKSQGVMILKRPGQFFWHVLKPYEQTITVNNKNVSIYEPDLKQAIQKQFDQSMRQTPAVLLLEKTVDVQKRFDVRLVLNKNNKMQFILIPKDKNDLLSKIILVFNRDVLSQMQFINQLDQKTTVLFDHVKRNVQASNQQFRLNIPKDVDVVKE